MSWFEARIRTPRWVEALATPKPTTMRADAVEVALWAMSSKLQAIVDKNEGRSMV